MSTTYEQRNADLAPTILPEHLKAIREVVLKGHLNDAEFSSLWPRADRLNEVLFNLMEIRKHIPSDDSDAVEAFDDVVLYIRSQNRYHSDLWTQYQQLITGVVSWAMWATNWTKRLENDDKKSPPEVAKK